MIGILLGIAAAAPTSAKGPCIQLRAACEDAGFTAGAGAQGTGLWADCMIPLVRGQPQPPNAKKPLPQVSPEIVSQCRAKNPNLGQTATPDTMIKAPGDSTGIEHAPTSDTLSESGKDKVDAEVKPPIVHNQPNLPPAPSALHYTVDSVQTIPFSGRGPGESQSTVLLPGTNSACPSGVLLVSDDWQRPPHSIVYARHLSGNKPDIVSTFDLMPDSDDYAFPTNDHDLIALADGSVLYSTLGATKAPLGKKPGWWDIAYRPEGTVSFGPGARGLMMVWRSTDCGASFHYISKVDSAAIDDGSCAYPRPPRDSSGHYYMGGSDGPLTKLDPADGTLYLTFRCQGNQGSTNKKGEWVVSNTDLDKTLVARSSDGGTSWQSMGFIEGPAWWRTGILPLGKRVAFAFSNDVIIADHSGDKLEFGPAHQLKSKYGDFSKAANFDPKPSPDKYMDANIWGNTVIARAGDSQGMLLAYPTIVNEGKTDKTRTNGYSVFFYDPQDSGTFSETKAIAPVTESPESYVMDVTAIDLGSGPVLLYWMDVNTATQRAKMRGRFIVSLGHYTSDFDITTDEMNLTAKANGYARGSKDEYFYGDYHTASGYVQQRGPALARKNIYHFSPLWVDRTNGASYAVVTVSVDAPLLSGPLPPLQPQLFSVAPEEWKTPPPAVDLNSFRGTMPKVVDALGMTPK